jgi:hypothetical protein
LFGFRDPIFFSSGSEPWRVQHGRYEAFATAFYRVWYWRVATGFGWFDPQRYLRPNYQADSLAQQIANWRARRSRVSVILLPERTVWRKQIPPEAKSTLLAVLRKKFGDQTPPVIDLRDTMSDEMFIDYAHLNEKGRAGFFSLVGETTPRAGG